MELRKPIIAVASAALTLTAVAVPAAAATSGSGLYIRGGGYGHDIGMSQYGAAGFAEHGYGYRNILEHYYSGTQLAKISASRDVTVLLSQGAQTFTGATGIKGSKIKLKQGTHYGVVTAGKRFELMSAGRKLKHGKKVAKFNAPMTVTGPGPLDLVGQGQYRGNLQFRFGGASNGCIDGSGGVAAINSVSLNDYVRGVISAEMPSSWPQQALDAQAVAARTYAITSGAVSPGRYDLYDNTCSQMYKGVAAETAATNAATSATSDQVVEYGGEPVTTYFFSSSGGHTKSIQFSWGLTPDAWLKGVSDPYDGAFGNPYHSWNKHFGVSSAAGKLGNVHGKLKGIKITPSTAEIVGTGGTTTLDGADLQGDFGTLSPNMTFTTITDKATTTTVSAAAASASTGATTTATSSGSGSSSASNGSSAAGSGTSTSPSTTSTTTGGSGLLGSAAAALTGAQTTTTPATSTTDKTANVKTAQAKKAAKKVHEIKGTIFPVRTGRAVTVERNQQGGWKSVASGKLSASGSYTIRVATTGRYRVLYNGIDGPAVQVK